MPAQKDKYEATRQGVKDAWDFWFSQHPVSVPEIIQDAVKVAVREWLDEHSAEILEAISRRVPPTPED